MKSCFVINKECIAVSLPTGYTGTVCLISGLFPTSLSTNTITVIILLAQMKYCSFTGNLGMQFSLGNLRELTNTWYFTLRAVVSRDHGIV